MSYNAETNTIKVRASSATTLAAVSRALDRPEVLRELAPGEWLLSANLQIEKGAVVHIAAPEVRWLKLRSDDKGFVWVKVLGGQLDLTDTCISSWDVAANSYDENYADGRSFVLARNGARMDVRGAEVSYLGYGANESYGIAWRLEGTTGAIVNSTLGHNYYGLYSFQVSDLVIQGNEVHHSVQYGIDPHTRSNHLLIENNVSHHNGKHGIILAEGCNDSVVRNNVTHNNTLHGIVIYEGSNSNLVEGNSSYSNGLQGINVNNSSHTIVRDNTVYDNAEAGIGVGQMAKENLVSGNRVRANRLDGIVLYSDAAQNEVWGNTVSDNARYGIYVKSKGNLIVESNTVFGNLKADIRTSDK